MRLSIEVAPEQHQCLKDRAALRGQSIEDYVLERVLPDVDVFDESEALRDLESFLKPRIESALRGEVGNASKKGVRLHYCVSLTPFCPIPNVYVSPSPP